MQNEVKTPYKYFAAANGYGGFRSYFDEIFDSRDYDRIFVIKGGPGTGKSSLLKKIANDFFDKGLFVEAIYCSSDNNSLDGVIIEKDGKRVALIDATAPHERDAKVPGAIDTIINLGEMWNEEQLTKSRDLILNLNEKKKIAYRDAYDYLEIIGYIDRKIAADYKSNNYYQKVIDEADSFANENFRLSCSGKRTRLTSAFNRQGYTSLDTLQKVADKTVRVSGDGVSEYIYMSALKRASDRIGTAYTASPSPFSDDITEELYFPELSLTVSTHKSANNTIDTSRLVTRRLPANSSFGLEKSREIMLSYAKDAFTTASELHFKLEKIYTAAMDFEKLNQIILEIEEQITDILGM